MLPHCLLYLYHLERRPPIRCEGVGGGGVAGNGKASEGRADPPLRSRRPRLHAAFIAFSLHYVSGRPL